MITLADLLDCNLSAEAAAVALEDATIEDFCSPDFAARLVQNLIKESAITLH